MDKRQYTSHIQQGVNRLDYRNILVDTTLQKPQYIALLLDFIHKTDSEAANHAARLLELTVKKQWQVLLPYLNQFSGILTALRQDASIRACAKMIEICCVNDYIKQDKDLKETLRLTDKERFIEVSFDWMIADKSIAIQAHSMYSLYLLGLEFDWIHSELALLIGRKLPLGSAGFQNRAKKILKSIETKKLLKLY